MVLATEATVLATTVIRIRKTADTHPCLEDLNSHMVAVIMDIKSVTQVKAMGTEHLVMGMETLVMDMDMLVLDTGMGPAMDIMLHTPHSVVTAQLTHKDIKPRDTDTVGDTTESS